MEEHGGGGTALAHQNGIYAIDCNASSREVRRMRC